MAQKRTLKQKKKEKQKAKAKDKERLHSDLLENYIKMEGLDNWNELCL